MSEALKYTLPEHLAARQSAKRREWGIQVAAVLVTVICLVAAGFLVRPVNTIRQERQLVIDPRMTKGLPPDIALLGKLGTFRALAIDWASIRAERLKEEGKTYEALDLHETVCALACMGSQGTGTQSGLRASVPLGVLSHSGAAHFLKGVSISATVWPLSSASTVATRYWPGAKSAMPISKMCSCLLTSNAASSAGRRWPSRNTNRAVLARPFFMPYSEVAARIRSRLGTGLSVTTSGG